MTALQPSDLTWGAAYPDGELLNRLPLTANPRTRPQVEGQQFLSPLSLCQRRVPGFPSFAQQPPAPATDPTLATHNLTKLKERTPLRIQPEFPDYRYQDPKRQAELRVYQEIASSQIPGQALYEVNTTRHTPQVDIVVWVEGVACFAISVKGGTYSVDNGTIFLHTPEGTDPGKEYPATGPGRGPERTQRPQQPPQTCLLCNRRPAPPRHGTGS